MLPMSGCGVFDTGPSPKEVASSFVRAFAAGDSKGAARGTDAPKQAQPALESARKSLAPKVVRATVGKVTEAEGETPAKARFDVTWDFGNGRVWKYSSELKMVDAEEGLKVDWAPSVIHPKLGDQQRLTFAEQPPELAPVFDRDGTPLLTPQDLVTVSLDPQQAGDIAGVAGSLANALGGIDPGITRESIMAGAAETPPGQPYVVATLRQADYEQVKPQIYELPGVRFPSQTKLVAAQREFGKHVLSGIAKQVDEQAASKAGWRIATVNAAGVEAETLHDVPPRPTEPVTVTLSEGVQKAAEQAVDPVPQATMLVAMRPSSGEVLAVAQNAPADDQGPIALTGQYPPGSTFKMVTATAALESGRVGIDTPVQCPAKKTFGGREVPNDHDFELGTVPLRTAFAKSCNTTFAQLAVDQPANALTDAAQRLGLGVDFDMPGSITLTGKVPPAEETVQRAANGFGQGTVLASPFGMALATSSVVHGSMPTPTLIKGLPTKANAQPQPPSPKALDQLRPMMREVVLSGTATQLAGSGEVSGKTGTAQFGDGTHSHGWFVGFRGDLAFAVLITDAGSSTPAVDLAGTFLGNLP